MIAGAPSHVGPLLLAALPLVAALGLLLAAWLPRLRLTEALRHAVVFGTTLLVLAGLLALLPEVLAHGAVEVSVPALLGELRFRLDAVSALLALLSSVVWGCSSLHAAAYFRDEPARTALRYHLTSLVSFAAMLTLLMAADLVTLYVGFEWLGLVAYLFVVHTGSKAAESAGLKYLVLTLLGGFSVLAGVLLVHAMGGGDLAGALPLAEEHSGLRAAAAACLLLGFGVKAGALGLHSWLPDAHSAAPAPASAVLSGVMIKAGAYGIVRTLGNLYRVEAEQALEALRQAETLGLLVLWWGVATMLVGVVMALWQHQAKRLLAYSSVSQMGFVLAGVGAAVYLGERGGIGWTGSLLHVVNHGLFKALLFLGVGAVIVATGSGDLRRLGGLARRMPWTFAFMAVGVAGIAGLPLLNGFVSKSVIHHALEYAIEQAQAGGRPHGLVLAERLFTLTTVGTAAALVKLLWLTFLGKPRAKLERTPVEAPWPMRVALAVLAAAVVALGLRPQLAAPLLTSALDAWRLPSADVLRWLSEPMTHAGDLSAALGALAVGAALHVLALRTNLYARSFPTWLSLDWAVAALLRFGQHVTRRLQVAAEAASEPRVTGRALLERGQAGLERGRTVEQRRLQGWRAALTGSEGGGSGYWWVRRYGAFVRHVQRVLVWLGRALPERVRGRLAHARARALASGRALGRGLLGVSSRLDASWRLAREVGRMGDEEREWVVLEARSRIRRHNRDVGLSMGLLLLVWLIVLASLSLVAAR